MIDEIIKRLDEKMEQTSGKKRDLPYTMGTSERHSFYSGYIFGLNDAIEIIQQLKEEKH